MTTLKAESAAVVQSIEDIDAPLLQESRVTLKKGYLKVVIYATQTKGKKETSMKRTIIYVGLDVDDTQYHGSAMDQNTGELIDFKCRPTLKGLLAQLDKLGKYFPRRTLRVCYEASYIGYTLQRDLANKGYHCDVVAPHEHSQPAWQTNQD